MTNRAVCWITFTNAETHRVLRENLHRAPMFSGQITSTGPRYCPSIEDKVVRFADRERHQVGRDRLRHAEGEFAVQFCGGVVAGAHHGPQLGRGTDRSLVRNSNARRVLQRDEAARVDRLGLRVQERMAFAGGLLWFQPLQRECVRGCRVADHDFRRVRRHLDAQWSTQVLRFVADRERRLGKTVARSGTNGFDREPASIEDQRPVGFVQAIDVQPGLAKEHPLFKIDGEVEVDMGRAVVVRVRQRMVVEPGRRGGD